MGVGEMEAIEWKMGRSVGEKRFWDGEKGRRLLVKVKVGYVVRSRRL